MNVVLEQPRYSCALAAQQTVLAIPGAHPIIHAGPGCSQKVFSFAAQAAGHQGEGYAGGSNVSCTNSSEQDVVFGGERKLRQAIDGALRVMKGDLFVVMTGCTADIVGDDSVSLAREFAGQGKPVVGTETAGFKGNSYYGHEKVVNAIIEQYVGDVPVRKRKGLVNVFSVVPYQDPYWRADLETIKSLLERIGLEVNILFGYGSGGAAEWRDIPNAEFNLLVSPWVGLTTVRLLEKKYGTPFLHYPVVPVGARETSAFLRSAGAYAGIPETRVEAVIQREEKRFYQYLISLVDFLAEFRNNLPSELYTVADSIYGVGISGFLVNEIGFIPRGLYITDGIDDETAGPLGESYREIILNSAVSRDEQFRDILSFEADGGLVQRDIREKLNGSKRALFLGSGWEKFLAQETGNLYGFISLPLPETIIINQGFLGYDGGLNLVEEVYSNVFKTKTTTHRIQSS
jgi:nitrogenase molybdenum-iron protein beta chain